MLTVNFVDLVLGAVLIAMMIRAILSLVLMGEENGFSILLYYFTEPFILPVRKILERLGLFQGTPFDVSFFLTTVLLGMIQSLLAVIPM
ncbi:MAG: YggT family protein [Clostridia bacterium]|nr:YggT family protein [Clostridia bacterium]